MLSHYVNSMLDKMEDSYEPSGSTFVFCLLWGFLLIIQNFWKYKLQYDKKVWCIS